MSPPTVAILGASADRAKFGNKSLRAHVQAGYRVFPVNPRGEVIEGLPAYKSLVEVPAELDRVSVYLPPDVALAALDQVAAKGCRQLWLNPGSESPAVLERARALGLQTIAGCSIVDLGLSPAQFP